jgi:hypothetical protein
MVRCVDRAGVGTLFLDFSIYQQSPRSKSDTMEEVQRSHFPPERQENKASEQVYVTTVIYYYIYDNSRITATPIVKTVSKRDMTVALFLSFQGQKVCKSNFLR